MTTYVILIRGINVGGKNKIPMAELKSHLEAHGFASVTTYIQSGNVILKSDLDAETLASQVETLLATKFKLDSPQIRVLALTREQFQRVVAHKPDGFGEEPEKYHSDAIFLIGIDAQEAMSAFDPREGVDQVWAGEGVIYSQRLSAQRTKSRLNKIMAVPAYKLMTIRNWNTTTKLLELLLQAESDNGI